MFFTLFFINKFFAIFPLGNFFPFKIFQYPHLTTSLPIFIDFFVSPNDLFYGGSKGRDIIFIIGKTNSLGCLEKTQ